MCVRADGNVYGRETESLKELGEERDGNIRKQSFNGAENNENGKREAGKGCENAVLCAERKQSGRRGKNSMSSHIILW